VKPISQRQPKISKKIACEKAKCSFSKISNANMPVLEIMGKIARKLFYKVLLVEVASVVYELL